MSRRRPKWPVVQYATAFSEVDGVNSCLITAVERVRTEVALVGSVEVRFSRYVAELRRLVVLPRCRRRGIATELMRRAWTVAMEARVLTLTWQVDEENLEALAFYLGFSVNYRFARVVHAEGGHFWMSLPAQGLARETVVAALAKREATRRVMETELPNGAGKNGKEAA